ncbi:MAG TPA: Hsp20/alpha crystallin family protein [Dehalococcoidia bacterium]|nr:Hsp20/alpha crystallin family protein [Dehalococcoidia bacterium]
MTQETTKRTLPARTRSQGITDLRGEVDRLWDTLLSTPWRPFQVFVRPQAMAPMDVFEKEGHLFIRAELPGMTEKDVNVEVTGDAITISGEKKDEREVKEDNYYRSERTFGSFKRQVSLPSGADADHINAKFKDGVLEIDVPIDGTKAAGKKIEVRAGA